MKTERPHHQVRSEALVLELLHASQPDVVHNPLLSVPPPERAFLPEFIAVPIVLLLLLVVGFDDRDAVRDRRQLARIGDPVVVGVVPQDQLPETGKGAVELRPYALIQK